MSKEKTCKDCKAFAEYPATIGNFCKLVGAWMGDNTTTCEFYHMEEFKIYIRKDK